MELADLAADLSNVFGFPVHPENPLLCDGMPIDGHRGTAVGIAEQGRICLGAGMFWVNTNSPESPTWIRVPGISAIQENRDNQENQEPTNEPCSEPTVTNGSPPAG